MAEEKEYMTLEEAATYVGIKRATVYNYMHDLSIKGQKFGRDRRTYLSLDEVKRLKEYREKPWKQGGTEPRMKATHPNE